MAVTRPSNFIRGNRLVVAFHAIASGYEFDAGHGNRSRCQVSGVRCQ